MSMSRAERFNLRHAIVKALGEPGWDWDRTNLLFAEFELPRLGDGYDGPAPADIVAQVEDDDVLVELFAIVAGVPVEDARADTALGTDDVGLWKPGYLRLFLSHSAVYKALATSISDHLAVLGIDAFVAHETMEVSRPWQAQIEHALRTMEGFVLLDHPEATTSPWCHQETGWALGRRLPFFVVRMGADPIGFPGSLQWPSLQGRSGREVADRIAEWIGGVEGFGEVVFERLLDSLARVGNYYDAEAVAARIASLGTLSEEQLEQLDRTWWSNDQLWNGVLPTRKMRPFYERLGRPWPPPKPTKGTLLDPDGQPF